MERLLKDSADSQKRAAASRNLKLSVELENDQLPSVSTDAGILKRIISGLIENSMKYTPENGEIRLAAKKCDEKIAVTITDNGCGIAKEDLPHIFERYYRGKPYVGSKSENDEQKESNETSGIGLGLYLVKNLAEQIQVEISVESPVNENQQGTRFTLFV